MVVGRVEVTLEHLPDECRWSEFRALTASGAWHNEDPTWSPDGRLIAYISNRLSVDPNKYGILIVPATCNTAATPIAFMVAPNIDYQAPAWSPDGRKLAFRAMYASGYTDIFVADVDPQGNRVGEPQQLTSAPTSESGPIWVY